MKLNIKAAALTVSVVWACSACSSRPRATSSYQDTVRGYWT